jgi:hypothetical protein
MTVAHGAAGGGLKGGRLGRNREGVGLGNEAGACNVVRAGGPEVAAPPELEGGRADWFRTRPGGIPYKLVSYAGVRF